MRDGAEGGKTPVWLQRRRMLCHRPRFLGWLLNFQNLVTSAARWADRVGLRAIFPAAARRHMHVAKKWLFRQPLHLTFAHRAGSGPPVFLIVVGEPFADWVPALMAPDTWQDLPGVVEVVVVLDDLAVKSLPSPTIPGSRTVVLPLREDAIVSCPPSLGLYPDARAVGTLVDKRHFADYVTRNGLDDLCPTTFARPQDIRLPCIVKKTLGVHRPRVLHTHEELDALLAREALDPDLFAVQEFIPGDSDYTTHAIVKNGRVLWSSTLRFLKDGETRFALEFKTMQPVETPPSLLKASERLLRPLGYSGPCNVDYTIRKSGQVAVFEVNPRFGGSMFLPQNRDLLKQALTCLIENAIR